ncbi:MAG: agmatine deiminase family protein [Puniceicoccaceae bacterium]|nr:MAG: agmatine deiminase family protein [Puniceicoccaceae bacterium]
MPAEWAHQEAVWLSWPHKTESWPGFFEAIPPKFAEIAALISRFQEVRINCAAELQDTARHWLDASGAVPGRIRLFDHATDDAWCRDHGPIFVKHRETGEVAATDWRYNAWGDKYPPYEQDNRIPGLIAEALGLRRFVFDSVLEGGSIDVNGAGLLLTTEACLLNPNRNPGLDRGAVERMLRDGLGVDGILWLGDGIEGDDTDGHIDDLSRFFREDGIVTVVDPDPASPNHEPLRENLARLRTLRTPAGRPFDIRELPMPERCEREGQVMPASYANFLIINGAVLYPTFRQPARDFQAGVVLADCFDGRQIIPVDCLDLVWGLGTLHCISQQQPA